MKFLIIASCMLAVASAGLLSNSADAAAETLSQASEINPDGSYSYSYQTSNGISGQEAGNGGVIAQGTNSWTAPDGTPVQISYVADENGYQPSGAFIPTPPPVPEAILRAIEYIRANPGPDSFAN